MLGPRNMGAGTPSFGHNTTSSKCIPENGRYVNVTPLPHGGITQTPAQRLIEQYERLSTPPPRTPPPLVRNKSTYRRQYVYDHTVAPSSLSTPDDKDNWRKKNANLKKDRSPIRQSLRNLLSVFKKGAGKRKLEDVNLPVPSSEDPIPATRLSKERGVVPNDPPWKKMTGPLVYLTHGSRISSPNTPGPCMWSSCSVTLDENKLLLSSFNCDMEMSLHEITLAQCSDIRSISTSQLSAEEARLLESVPEGENLKVFEMVFDGRPKEKFAAKSVRERAGWISAIWDAILPNQEAKSEQHVNNASAIPGPEVDIQPGNHLPVQSPVPTPLPQTSNLLSSSYSDRSLPPVPSECPLSVIPPLVITGNNSKKPNLHLDLSEFEGPISPSIYPPTSQAPSLASSPGNGSVHPRRLLRVDTSVTNSNVIISPRINSPASHHPPSASALSAGSSTPTSACPSSSPSIANLSQLSVVRQRLAQIERNHSQLSSQSGISGMTARISSPSPVSPAGSAWLRREAIFHNAGIQSARSGLMSPVGGKGPRDFCESEVELKGIALNERACSPPRSSRHYSRQISKSQRPDEDEYLRSPPANCGPSKDDIRKISNDLTSIQGVLGGESGYPTIHQLVVGLDHRAQGDKKALRAIQDTLSILGRRVADAITAGAPTAEAVQSTAALKADTAPFPKDDGAVIHALKELKDHLSTEFPALASKLQEIRDAQETNQSTTFHNIAAPSSPSPSASDSRSVVAVDLQPLLVKLEEIRLLCDAPPRPPPPETPEHKNEDKADNGKCDAPGDPQLSEHVTKILNLIQEDSNKQILLAQQQADSVRYLNELNSWLESFVSNGTSQIQGISANIERLCNEIGCNSQQLPGGPQSNLLHDIRQLVAGMKARDQNFASLQGAVHSLLEVLTVSQTQKGADSQALAGLMDRQRHDQEALFRAFTSEISGEIKGERLRFVEAMKEATAINVQIHVEQFKQELGREVMSMTEEVGRLHREKQVVENQISDLFSFYSKHKQADMPPQKIHPNATVPALDTPRSRANIPRSHHRPLPYAHHINRPR